MWPFTSKTQLREIEEFERQRREQMKADEEKTKAVRDQLRLALERLGQGDKAND